MSTPSEKLSPDCAVRLAADAAGRQALDDCLARQHVTDVAAFKPKDDDELNASLRRGRFRHVFFSDLDAILSMLWKGHADLDHWVAAGVRIELAQPPQGCEREWLAALARTSENLARWRKTERRHKTFAAALLSAIALLAAALLFFAASN